MVFSLFLKASKIFRSILEMLRNLRVIRKSLVKNWESSEVFGLVKSWAVWPLITIFGVPGVFLAVSRVFRGYYGMFQGCSGVVPGCSGLFRGCSGDVPGCSGGVPRCSGVFRGIPGFTDTREKGLFSYDRMEARNIHIRTMFLKYCPRIEYK